MKFLNAVLGGVSFLVMLAGFAFMSRQSDFSRLPKRWTPPLEAGQYIPNQKCIVCHSVDPGEYSLLAAQYAAREHTTSIFTVCGYEPRSFIAKIEEARSGGAVDSDNFDATALRALGKDEFLELVKSVFPHFEALQIFHAGKRGSVCRILLETDSGWLRRNRHVLDLFYRLNGDVPCWVATTQSLRLPGNDVQFLTDHVVFNSQLCVDYYDESQTLIITCEDDGPIKKEFAKLEANFKQKSTTALYRRLDAVICPPADNQQKAS